MRTPLTSSFLLATASERGIFTAPTLSRGRGYVLLGSLGLNLRDPSVLEDLHDLHAAGEIRLEARDCYSVVVSLLERGVNTALIRASAVPLWARDVHAVEATATVTTGTGLSEDDIRAHGHLLDEAGACTNDVNDALGIVDLCTGEKPGLDTVRRARARVAAAINARRGVLVEAEDRR